jgi:predicted transcriptional regulator YdeE
MSTLIEMTIRPFPATRLVGKQVVCGLSAEAENLGPVLWESMMQDGTLDFLKQLPQRATPEADTVGWMGEYDPASNTFTYIAGILANPGALVPEGCTHRDLPACHMAVASIRGTDANHDVYAGAHDHAARVMQEYGYEPDPEAGGFEMEYYSDTRFNLPLSRGDEFVILDYCVPCRKQKPLP